MKSTKRFWECKYARKVIGDCGDLKVAKSFRKLVLFPQCQDAVDIELHSPDLHTGAWEEHTRMPLEFMISFNKEGFVHRYRAGLGCR